MAKKNHLAKKRYWKGVAPKKRSKIMSAIASVKQSRMTPEARRAHGKMMAQARWGNKNSPLKKLKWL